MLEGSCDCGAVRYTVDGTLDQVTECNCGICPAHGGAVGVLFAACRDDDGPDGHLHARRSHLEIHRCKTCGGVMFWTPVDKTYDRMGVNAHMLPPGFLGDGADRQMRRGELVTGCSGTPFTTRFRHC